MQPGNTPAPQRPPPTFRNAITVGVLSLLLMLGSGLLIAGGGTLALIIGQVLGIFGVLGLVQAILMALIAHRR
jgi:hypothetical protein